MAKIFITLIALVITAFVITNVVSAQSITPTPTKSVAPSNAMVTQPLVPSSGPATGLGGTATSFR